MFRPLMTWHVRKMPDLAGKTIVVTGSNSGIGFAAASVLAARGADVIMACRDQKKGARAREQIEQMYPGSKVTLASLDLSDLSSVRSFASELDRKSIDVLVNNAGVMALPFAKTKDGFEMQLGTNHLGHFALTALLYPRLCAAAAPRVVVVASVAHWFGKMRWDNLNAEKKYGRWPAYCQSKLANLLFMKELARRASDRVLSVACHPGYASTSLQTKAAQMEGATFTERIMSIGNNALAQSAGWGAMPTLYAATADDLEPGDYIGPAGLLELVGPPVKVKATGAANDPKDAKRLWEVSEELTKVRFEL
jgi:NAD(P)-dependent dehydrogenase (short-subunit alcohol dehydrogenase family)